MKLFRTALVLGGLAATAAALAKLGGRTLGTAWSEVLAPGPASLDQLAAALAGTAVAGLAGWLALGLVAAAASALCTTTGRTAGRAARLVGGLSRRTAPVALRRLVAALLGAGMVLGTAGPALASGPGRLPGAAAPPAVGAVQPAGDLDPTWAGDRLPGPRTRAPLGDEVVVRRGDTLWDLAARQLGPGAGTARIAAEWPRWYAANRALIGPDPDRLEPGQRLRVPAAEVER